MACVLFDGTDPVKDLWRQGQVDAPGVSALSP